MCLLTLPTEKEEVALLLIQSRLRHYTPSQLSIPTLAPQPVKTRGCRGAPDIQWKKPPSAYDTCCRVRMVEILQKSGLCSSLCTYLLPRHCQILEGSRLKWCKCCSNRRGFGLPTLLSTSRLPIDQGKQTSCYPKLYRFLNNSLRLRTDRHSAHSKRIWNRHRCPKKINDGERDKGMKTVST